MGGLNGNYKLHLTRKEKSDRIILLGNQHWEGRVNGLEKLMATKKQITFPGAGYCRVETCGDFYSHATGGRKGMCKTHYRYADQLVKNGELTWDQVDKKWPAAEPFVGLDAPDIEKIRMLETEFQNHVVDFLIRNGHGVWLLDATRRKGIPDLLIVTKSGKPLFRELKASGQLSSEDQQSLSAKMVTHNADVGVWEPADLQSGRIAQEVSE